MSPSDLESDTIEVVVNFDVASASAYPTGRVATEIRRDSFAVSPTSVEAYLVRKRRDAGGERGDDDASAPSAEGRRAAVLSPAPGCVIGDKYRLEAPLASGGMGAVWTARHIDLDVPVAIKLMAPNFDASPQDRARFIREARAAAKLRSRNVVAVLDYGVDRETQYIVMERLEGEDLCSRLERVGAMSPAEIAPILDAIVNGLDLAHRAGIVHRDLKPENIFLAKAPGEPDEVVKVLDFGIAKELNPFLDEEQTKSGVVIGTPHYMSPEQAIGARDIDHRSDLWSLGVILFRAVTGRLLFEDMSAIEVLTAVADAPIPAPSSVAEHVSSELDPFFARALHRDPARRFQSALEMAAAFRSIAAGLRAPAQARPRAALDATGARGAAINTGDFIAIDAAELDVWACGSSARAGSDARRPPAPPSAPDAAAAADPTRPPNEPMVGVIRSWLRDRFSGPRG